jgi:hypothetical protein
MVKTIKTSPVLQKSDSKTRKVIAQKDRKIREKLNEKQIDKMIKDGFPASDPPSTY